MTKALKNPIRYIFLSLVIAVTSSCGGSSSSSPPNNKPETLTITSVVPQGGSIIPSSAKLSTGESIQFTVSSEPGYTLKGVSGCNGSLSGQLYVVEGITSSCAITVELSKNTYLVDSVLSTGGNIDKRSSDVLHGDSLDLRLIPHTDHKLNTVSGCSGVLSQLLYSISSVIQDCTVNVAFSSLLPETEPPLTRIRIPLVFHILDAGFTDVSEEEIISQIEVTNTHFRQYNLEELEGLASEDKRYVADIGIQFYLADKNPQGEHHSGIVRVNTQTSAFDEDYRFAQTDFEGSAPWPNDRYVNIWVGDYRDRLGNIALAGRAHIPTIAPDEYIGISIEESVVGIIDPEFPNLAQGKTLTHELAHFFGLIGHTDGNITEENNHARLTCDGLENTDCKNSDLSNNFMGTPQSDEDMKMFSLSQQQVIREWLETGPLSALYQNSLEVP